MQRKRLFNVLSLIINLAIIFFTVDANLYNFRTDIIRNDLVFGFDGVRSFCFFTVLSNVFLAISCAIVLFFDVKNAVHDEYKLPVWAFKVKFAATVSVTVTMLTVIFFLAPISAFSGRGYFALFTGNNLYLHFLSPLLALITFIFFESIEEFGKKDALLGIIPTAAYSVVYIIMVVFIGEENGGWPAFYGFTFGGRLWLSPVSAVLLLGATYLFGLGIFKIKTGIAKKKNS